jgi:hypothetical protein
MKKLSKVLWFLLRFLFYLCAVLLCLFILSDFYGELMQREQADVGSVRVSLQNCTYYAARYLHDTPQPERNINLIGELIPYIIAEGYPNELSRYQSGYYAFYVLEDIAWVGHELPKAFWTKGYNRSREKLQDKRNLYGSASLISPPLEENEQYYYQQRDDAVWLKVRNYPHDPSTFFNL